MNYTKLEVHSWHRRWRLFVMFFPVWCALAISPGSAGAQVKTAKASPCNASQLSATEDRDASETIDGGLGHQALTISIENRSASACVLHGTPKLTFADSSGSPFSAHVCSNCPDFLFGQQSVKTFLLEPNRSALVFVGYRTDCRKAAALGFDVSDQERAIKITITGMLDPHLAYGPKHCATVDVTPFLEKPPTIDRGLPPHS